VRYVVHARDTVSSHEPTSREPWPSSLDISFYDIDVVGEIVATRRPLSSPSAGGRSKDANTFSLSARKAHRQSNCVNGELIHWSDAVMTLTGHRGFGYRLVAREAPPVIDTRHAIAHSQ
jgi:hypothetical protein